MLCSQPLPDAHPELFIIETPLGCEYRVENGPLSCGQRGRTTGSFPWLRRFDAFTVMLVGVLWTSMRGNAVLTIGTGIGLALLAYQNATRVLWESVIVLPSYGIQLETHRGLPSLPLFASRKFIPLADVKDILINEGLRRWDVRYYLTVFYCPQPTVQRLAVAYENTLPRFPVLIEVYNGIHDLLHGK